MICLMLGLGASYTLLRSVCVLVCVCERASEKLIARERGGRERVCVSVCVCIYLCIEDVSDKFASTFISMNYEPLLGCVFIHVFISGFYLINVLLKVCLTSPCSSSPSPWPCSPGLWY